MAERTQDTARTNEPRSLQDSHTRHTSRTRGHRDDDVIASLANARENRRARQVGEWERVGFRTIYRVV